MILLKKGYRVGLFALKMALVAFMLCCTTYIAMRIMSSPLTVSMVAIGFFVALFAVAVSLFVEWQFRQWWQDVAEDYFC